MAEVLPEKVKLNGVKPEHLPASEKTKYDAYYAEKARRKDITQEGVAQEALDVLDEINARSGSSSEVFTVFGYSLRVLKQAIAERERIQRELAVKPSKDVKSSILDVSQVMAMHGIKEWVKPVEPE